MSRLSLAGAALVEDLLAVVDGEIQRATHAAINQHVDAFHRQAPTRRRRLFSQKAIPEQLALVLAERLDTEPDITIAALAEEYGYPPALVEYTVAELRGQHTEACRTARRS